MLAATATTAVAACGPPAANPRPGDDPTLLQEVVSRQERRVTDARAHVAKLERELRLVQMRRRMLERDGRHDLAIGLEMEQHGLESQLTHARRTATDEGDALAIYRRQSAAATPRATN